MAILDVNNLTIDFGGLRAVDNFHISIEKKELVGLIGPNGAGKTTVFNMLTGVYKPTLGTIEYSGVSALKKTSSQIVGLGVSRTFQNIRLFKNLTVLENLLIAYHNHMSYTLIESVFKTKRYQEQEEAAKEYCMELLAVFDLQSYADVKSKNLPYGKQRKLEIARALATKPKILMLDEPAAGMNPQETDELMETIKFVRDKFEVSILLIEHDMKLVMGICERLVVIDYGKIIAEGLPKDIRSNKDVIRAYLGE